MKPASLEFRWISGTLCEMGSALSVVMEIYNSFNEMVAGTGQMPASGNQHFTENQPHRNFGDKGGRVDFCVERYDQVGNGYPEHNNPNYNSPPIVDEATKKRVGRVCLDRTPFWGAITVGHSQLPDGNVVVYDGNDANIVTVGNWSDAEIQKALETAAKQGNGRVPSLSTGWETKLYIG